MRNGIESPIQCFAGFLKRNIKAILLKRELREQIILLELVHNDICAHMNKVFIGVS